MCPEIYSCESLHFVPTEAIRQPHICCSSLIGKLTNHFWQAWQSTPTVWPKAFKDMGNVPLGPRAGIQNWTLVPIVQLPFVTMDSFPPTFISPCPSVSWSSYCLIHTQPTKSFWLAIKIKYKTLKVEIKETRLKYLTPQLTQGKTCQWGIH